MTIKKIRQQWDENPLKLILGLAIIFRLLAVIFSKGYGMLDDHFLVIEAAQSWVDDYDYNNWLPRSGATGPQGHNFFYAGIHYLLLYLLEILGLTDPQGKMYLIRLLHAAFSLLVVYYGYKITARLAGPKSARQVGLLLALLWFMPFISVRNMVEVVCIPFLLYGSLILVATLSAERIALSVKHKAQNRELMNFVWAGILFGIAFSIRYQTLVFAAGICLVMIFNRKFLQVLIMAGAFALSVFLAQGLTDIYIWGYPFAELWAYVTHNIAHRTEYIVSPWYNYILLLLGMLIPPVSFFLFFGFFRTGMFRKYLIIFIPTLLFLVFHSIYPNKQERFILPILPFVVMLGIIGWNGFVEKSAFWQQRTKLLKACWIFFWIINLALLPLVSATYSKRAKVEAMTYLSKYHDIRYIIFENSNKHGQMLFPRYYLDEWIRYYEITMDNRDVPLPDDLMTNPQLIPRFFVFVEETDLESRVGKMQELYTGMVYETKIEPGLIDKVLYWLNPINANETITIYRNSAIISALNDEQR